MFRLLKYVKPYIWLVIAAIILLFVLANADLALPDYLSQIVNIGIQQNGVDSGIPDAIRESQMNKLILFLSPEEQELVMNSYQLVVQDSEEYDSVLATYPTVEDEPVYILKELDKEQSAELEPVTSRGLSLLYGITQIVENPDRASALVSELPFEIPDLPAGIDLFTALKMMPAAQLEARLEQITAQFDTLPSTLTEQLTAQAIKDEYQALGMDLGNLQTNYILKTGGIMLLVSLISGIANIAVSYLAARSSAGVARDIREDVFEKVESFSSQEFRNFSTASLITRATNDVTQIQQVVFMLIRMAFFAPIIGIGGVLRAIDKSPNMWWIIALAVGILLILIIIVFLFATPKFKIIQKLIDRLNLVIRENLTGMMVIRAFNKQSFEEKRFDQANKDLTGVMLFINRVMAAMMPLMMLIMNGLSVLIIWVGANQIADSTLLVGDMMAFLQYSMQIMFAFLMLSMLFIFLPRAFVSGDRIADVLETENLIKDPQEPKTFPEHVSGKIEFRDVCFRYQDAEECVLNDINFTINPGEVTAFIGSTGSGKSTLVNLIPRFYDVAQGAVLIDDIDVRDVGQHDLRDQIGYVPQQGILFSGTVESNLRFADLDAEEKTLRESIEIAQAADFVFEDPQGLQAEISQGGSNVSGGQKQRLSIARALVKKPPIFIFDDSFSALDFKTDSALRRALKDKTGESTVLMVTQRVATVKAADQIIVLENGNIVGKGSHQELMKTCQTYQEIATSQLSEEELA
jgi:ATP-binding cassette subfamily B protein